MGLVIDTRRSRNSRLFPLGLKEVNLLKGGFWYRYEENNRSKSIPKLYELFESKGILDNFRRMYGKKRCERRGPWFTDSDIYKWMEAAGWCLAKYSDTTIKSQLEEAINTVLPAQAEDGYLNTYFTDPKTRFTNPDAHEFYCAGHYIQAGIALCRAIDDDRILKSAIRFIDYLYNLFGPGKPRTWASGHPEIELALVELYRETGEERYLRFADHILNQLNPDASWKTSWSEDRIVPFVERTELYGHAVRNLYMACGGSDIWAETGSNDYGKAILRLWENLTNRKIYITGGVGSRYRGEAIGFDFELPNMFSYAETCAAIANVFWNYRNLQITADARFADWLERGLYNGVLSGISLDYTKYFYVNPLASFGQFERKEWYSTTCCPTNMVRLLSSLAGYFVSKDRSDNIYIHLYDKYSINTTVKSVPVKILVETDYPYDGYVKIIVSAHKPIKFALNLRIPFWSKRYEISLNEKSYPVESNGYYHIEKEWTSEDVIELDFDFTPQIIRSNIKVIDNFSRAAIVRGPLVYCIESPDNTHLDSVHLTAVKSDWDKSEIKINRADGFEQYEQEVKSITIPGYKLSCPNRLYLRSDEFKIQKIPTTITLVPYYTWANRGKSEMAVWIPTL